MRITWDEPKRKATLAERHLDFAMVTESFFESATVFCAKRGRLIAVGLIGAHAYAVVFEPLGTEAISIVSLRRASRKERRIP